MKIVKKNVYYCDHCKKRNLSASHMTKHENRCTANPDRECGICNVLEGSSPNIGEIVGELKKRFEINRDSETDYCGVEHESQSCSWIGEPITIEEIKKMVNDCPNCVLAILRQSRLNYECCGLKYDYKKEFDLATYKLNSVKREEQIYFH